MLRKDLYLDSASRFFIENFIFSGYETGTAGTGIQQMAEQQHSLRHLQYIFFFIEIMKVKNEDIQDIIIFVTADDSNLSGLSDFDDSYQEPETIINPQEQQNSDEESDEDSSEEPEDDKPLSELADNPA